MNSPLRYGVFDRAIPVDKISRLADGWLLAGEVSQHSWQTRDTRRFVIDKLLWFCDLRKIEEVDTMALRMFFLYCTNGHKEPGGRWGNPQMIQPVRPRTVQTYHCHLRTFFRWLVAEELLAVSPMERIPAPIARPDQVEPFTPDDLRALIAAAEKSKQPRRDKALIYFLLDTGVRAGELVGLQVADLDIPQRHARVLGKGNKERTVHFEAHTARALWAYLQRQAKTDADHVFSGQRGPMSVSGLRQCIERLGEAAGVNDAYPHRFRHTFAIEFLRSGGQAFALQHILGHTNSQMTQKYVNFASADIQIQQRRHSPVERLLKRGK